MKNRWFVTVSVLTVLLFTAFTACTQSPAKGGEAAASLDAVAFQQGLQQANVQILDVRSPQEFGSGHIANAMLADWNNEEEFKRRVSFLKKDQPVYIYCLSGVRSQYAMAYLVEQGFTQIAHLSGGIKSWKGAGLPVEGASNAPQIGMAGLTQAIGNTGVVLVDIGAPWCPPCRELEPVLQQFQQQQPAIKMVKVDGGNETAINEALQVNALPVLLLYKDGKLVWRKDGVATLAELTIAAQ